MTAADGKDHAKPSRLARIRAKYPWINHLVEAGMRYQGCKGDYFAAGATYFGVFALFPIAMVGFASVGFVLSSHPHLLAEMQNSITKSLSGSAGETVNQLVDQAIAARATVGVIGLVGAVWSGLGWMANLRQALTMQWGTEPEGRSFVRTKLSDLAALLGLGIALIVSLGLSALGSGRVINPIVKVFGLDGITGISLVVRVVSTLVSIAAMWLAFTWMIAKLPRVSLPLRNAAKAGLLTAVVFRAFTGVAAIYLQKIVTGPAGAVFGPILGIMVFAYISTRILLFATAWAATDPANKKYEPVPIPDPVVITPVVRESSLGTPGVVASAVAGLAAGLGIASLFRRR